MFVVHKLRFYVNRWRSATGWQNTNSTTMTDTSATHNLRRTRSRRAQCQKTELPKAHTLSRSPTRMPAVIQVSAVQVSKCCRPSLASP